MRTLNFNVFKDVHEKKAIKFYPSRSTTLGSIIFFSPMPTAYVQDRYKTFDKLETIEEKSCNQNTAKKCHHFFFVGIKTSNVIRLKQVHTSEILCNSYGERLTTRQWGSLGQLTACCVEFHSRKDRRRGKIQCASNGYISIEVEWI